jgi:phosphoribosylformylglycinamidine synthase subunit PurQ / glutaminase
MARGPAVKFGVVVFPGTWSDRDCGQVIEQVPGAELTYLWHKDPDLHGVDCVILPGGFSYGDYLRTGAIARFSPVMDGVVEFAERGGLVWGICNGFQILCETGLLPGALIRNDCLEFRCEWSNLVCEREGLPFTRELREGQVIRVPISHGEGNYVADPATLSHLEQHGQVVFRYCDPEGHVLPAANPNGSKHNIAGLVNRRGNVLGMMPHPERCADPEVGGEDGLLLFRSLIAASLVEAGR